MIVIRTCVFLLLCGAMRVAGQNALYIDLSGEWKMEPREDRAEFAQAGFDDRGWRTVTVPFREKAPVGYSWMRRTVVLPEGVDATGLALTVGGINEVYEVFVNGERVAQVGGPRMADSFVSRARTFPLPALPPGRSLVIALRLWRSSWQSVPERERLDRGPWLLTSLVNSPLHAGSHDIGQRLMNAVPEAIAGVFLLALAMVLLTAWTMQRQRSDLLLLALCLLCEAIRRGYPYASVLLDWPHGSHTVSAIFVSTGRLLLAHYATAVFGGYTRWVLPLAWLQSAIHIVVNVHFLLYARGAGLRSGLLGEISIAAVVLAVAWEGSGAIRDRERLWRAILIVLLAYGFLPQNTSSSSEVQIGITVSVALLLTVQLVRSIGAARQRLDQELQAARAVQQVLVSGSAVAGIETEYLPAQEVGGDFYQVFPLEDGGTLVAVGDVSGKGLKAAMVVSLVSGVLRNRRSDDPAALLGELNRALAGALDGGFVTAVLVRFHADGRVTIANAGHPAPYVDGEELEMEAGLPLGLVAEAAYANFESHLERGRQVTLVSDGVVEAANAKGELFGFDRTRAISRQPAAEIAEAARAWGQNDDITVLTVQSTAVQSRAAGREA